ncbi:hypothetical protein OESDEN_10809 [Oesophagostomum dentatum]|uniref:Uncharacterized protein n=1 Tax=Oesophagostomum dentatum TaxID=61180 RepID=A0A0B1SVM8_OESDE|nr:hypothetical protein OESDEN_10809 [Oesophagostomum dentatum]
MVQPQNCPSCPLTPRCVQQECNTACFRPCFFLQRCVLVATNCCPVSACRSIFFGSEGEGGTGTPKPDDTTKTPT